MVCLRSAARRPGTHRRRSGAGAGAAGGQGIANERGRAARPGELALAGARRLARVLHPRQGAGADSRNHHHPARYGGQAGDQYPGRFRPAAAAAALVRHGAVDGALRRRPDAGVRPFFRAGRQTLRFHRPGAGAGAASAGARADTRAARPRSTMQALFSSGAAFP